MTESYSEALSAAINHFASVGYESAEVLAYWQQRLRAAAEASLLPESEMIRQLREALGQTYKRMVDQGLILKYHPGASRWGYERIKPHLRAELDRRIFAASDLIRLNRKQAIDDTIQRLSGWVSSLPPGGPADAEKRERKAEIRKPLASLPFRERRVIIDQSSRMIAAVNDLVASDGGAIACRWRHIHHMPGYQARPEHVARDGRVYLRRESWARERGLVKPGPAGFSDEIDQPAELIFCRCSWVFLYGLRSLPEEMLTRKGQVAVEQALAQITTSTRSFVPGTA